MRRIEVGKKEAASERKERKGSARQAEKQWCKISIPERDHSKRDLHVQRKMQGGG